MMRVMTNVGSVFGLLLFSVLLAGCATIFSGTRDTITFESQPAGARVMIDGVDRGTTPLTTSVNRKLGGANVTYRLDGYETRTFPLSTGFNTVAIANILCFWGVVVCGGIDLITGAMFRYDVTNYDITLDPRRSSLEEELDVASVYYAEDFVQSGLGISETMAGVIRPNVALVNSATGQVLILR
jgi:uncharacterized protein YceK